VKILSFELTMPNVGSWNGKWSGADRKYYRTKSLTEKLAAPLIGKSFYYNFGDGWGASVSVEAIDGKEKRRRDKVTNGFCGYEWMIESILDHGAIYASREAAEQAKAKREEKLNQLPP
jgi:hypothetical protein